MSMQHAIGALVGSAVGDALGAAFEFEPAGLYRRTFPRPIRAGIGEMRGGGGFGWLPGEFTDDTQMAVALAESLVACEGFDPTDVWERWRIWARDARDVGTQTREVLAEPSREGAAARIHQRYEGRSAGNGSVMRNTPVAIRSANEPLERLAAVAAAQASLTHYDPRNAEAAVIHAAMIQAGILGEDVFAAIPRALETFSPAARGFWLALLDPTYRPDPHGTNGVVWTCLAEAVWAVRAADSFETAVVNAIDLGRDADTTACVAGGIAGALWGVQGIPSRWTTYLNGTVTGPDGVRHYDYAKLQSLVCRLVGRHDPSDAPDEPAAGPVRVHDDLPIHAANRSGAAAVGDEWQVISLCRTDESFTSRPVRRQVFLVDKAERHHNENPLAVVHDVVDTIDAFLEADATRPILVHCHGGRSRTALVLKAWAMRRFGWSEPQAHAWLASSWPRIHRFNDRFTELLRDQWLT